MSTLLDEVKKNARWLGRDAFPSNDLWIREVNRWLEFIKSQGRFGHYLPKLRDLPDKRNEALAEVAVAYFLVQKKGHKIIDWEPVGKDGKRGEFLLLLDDGSKVFCEVKSPGWESDFANRDKKSERLKMPKYINGEAGGFDNKTSLRYVIECKAYPKCPDDCLTLVIIADDFMISLVDDKYRLPEVLFYEQRKPPYVDENPNGIFVTKAFENLSAVSRLNFDCYVGGGQIQYSWAFYKNSNARNKFNEDI